MSEETFFELLILVPIALVILMLVGLILSFNQSEATKKTGKRLLIGSFLTLVVLLVIGFSICSGAFR